MGFLEQCATHTGLHVCSSCPSVLLRATVPKTCCGWLGLLQPIPEQRWPWRAVSLLEEPEWKQGSLKIGHNLSWVGQIHLQARPWLSSQGHEAVCWQASSQATGNVQWGSLVRNQASKPRAAFRAVHLTPPFSLTSPHYTSGVPAYTAI